jgi:hypothetical protein
MIVGNYGWDRSKFSTVQNIEGDYIFHSYRSQPSDSRNAMGLFSVNKTLDFIRGSVGLKGNYHRMENNLMSQGVSTDYTNNSYSLTPSINGNISSFLNWNLRFTWDQSMLSISEMKNRSSNNFIYSGGVTMTPCPLITWTVGGEFYRNEIETDRYKDMLMLDSKLTFNVSKRIELSVFATNLMNRKRYSYTTYGTVSQYERSSLLRGREFLISIYLKK